MFIQTLRNESTFLQAVEKQMEGHEWLICCELDSPDLMHLYELAN
jgi:hypothetical protein